ncbi:MAG: serine hydrolase domain-containing protein [Terracidiphilus sp.]|jgi:CubicO group peptidase (beta-lactamase class C family)
MHLFMQLLSARSLAVKTTTLALFWALLALTALSAPAQQKPSIAGDYAGTIAGLHLKLHLKADPAGTVTGTLDSTDQGAMGIPCADIRLDGQSLSFTVPAVNGKWKGTVSADGAALTGTWDQGAPQPLNFARDTFVSAAKPSPVDGIWLGALEAGGQSLRLQLQVKSDAAGKEYCTLDSLDQRAMGLECSKVVFAAPEFSFDVPIVHGSWAGKLSADGNSLSGTWNQGSPMALNFKRQPVALAPAPIPPPSYNPALPPVSAADLQSVLDKDLAEALKSGQLAPGTGAGVSIAVVEHGVHRVFSYGEARPDSIFEIGSITKTFTGLILSQLVEQGKVKLDEPVRELLPPGTVSKPAGDEITLLDLATQHSGLPRLPDNFKPANPANPYADYHAADLYESLAKHGVAKPSAPGFLYSNLGFGLLGQALAVRCGILYPALLKEQVADPLGLKDTTISLTPEQLARFIPGHSGDHRPAHGDDLDALAGAGAIRSTAGDILTYLEANLHPEALKPAVKSPAAATLSAALTLQHELRADAMPGTRIALAWLFATESGIYWHDGATGGYSSFAFFNPKGDYAAVVLLNTSIGQNGSFADRLGRHIGQRLAGKPAISLAN